MLEIRVTNKDYFKPWDPPLPARYFTLEGQIEVIREFRHARSQGSAVGFGVFLQDTHTLIGRVALRNIQRGAAQTCTLGYFIDQEYANQGYTTEAVKQVVSYAFRELKLHRIEAAVMPHNFAAIRVVEKLKFRREGLARWFLFIDNAWKDHYIYAITRPPQVTD